MTKTNFYQAGAFIVAVIGLYITYKRKPTVQQIQEAPPTQGVPSTLSFGNATPPGIQPGNIDIGGSPVYLNYNFPPANNPAQGVGTVSANPPNPPVAPVIYPRGHQGNGGCGCGCKQQQTFSSVNVGNADIVNASLNDLVGVTRRRWIIAPPTFHIGG